MHTDDDGYVDCPDCRGGKILKVGDVGLIKVCDRCKGNGRRDWVSHITGGLPKSNENIFITVTQQNVQVLMMLLREEAMKLGLRADIELHPDRRYSDPFSYQNRIYGGL